ncbi:WxL protein peptidoglycan domain-containing protein, partial [Companilactobacillus crustorum]
MTLAGNQTKRVTVNLKIPEQGFTGVLLGGLYLVDQEETAGTTGDGVQFKN